MDKDLEEFINKNYYDIKDTLDENKIKVIENTLAYSFFKSSKCFKNLFLELWNTLIEIKGSNEI